MPKAIELLPQALLVLTKAASAAASVGNVVHHMQTDNPSEAEAHKGDAEEAFLDAKEAIDDILRLIRGRSIKELS